MSNLGVVLALQDQQTKAEALLGEALAEAKKSLGEDHEATHKVINDLAGLPAIRDKLQISQTAIVKAADYAKGNLESSMKMSV